MEFTFWIITDGKNDNFFNIIIDSIIENNIPIYEIIIVGNTKIDNNSIKIINFDESIKRGWITKKKNIITSNAKYDNIVFLHDYIKLNKDWYQGFLKFGNDYEFCVSKIINANGSRFRDFTLFPYCVDYLNINYSPGKEIDTYFDSYCLLPYDFINNEKVNKYMYISGAYYIIKRDVSRRFLLDENLVHCQGEDVELSKRLHKNGIIIKCNKYATVSFLKYKEPAPWEKEISETYIRKLYTL